MPITGPIVRSLTGPIVGPLTGEEDASPVTENVTNGGEDVTNGAVVVTNTE